MYLGLLGLYDLIKPFNVCPFLFICCLCFCIYFIVYVNIIHLSNMSNTIIISLRWKGPVVWYWKGPIGLLDQRVRCLGWLVMTCLACDDLRVMNTCLALCLVLLLMTWLGVTWLAWLSGEKKKKTKLLVCKLIVFTYLFTKMARWDACKLQGALMLWSVSPGNHPTAWKPFLGFDGTSFSGSCRVWTPSLA